jgi:hypothetical protein
VGRFASSSPSIWLICSLPALSNSASVCPRSPSETGGSPRLVSFVGLGSSTAHPPAKKQQIDRSRFMRPSSNAETETRRKRVTRQQPLVPAWSSGHKTVCVAYIAQRYLFSDLATTRRAIKPLARCLLTSALGQKRTSQPAIELVRLVPVTDIDCTGAAELFKWRGLLSSRPNFCRFHGCAERLRQLSAWELLRGVASVPHRMQAVLSPMHGGLFNKTSSTAKCLMLRLSTEFDQVRPCGGATLVTRPVALT